MRVAYADPPYLGCCGLYGHFHGEDGRCWNDVETHWLLMERLRAEYPDGWALSATSASLPDLLSRHRWEGLRVAAWVKPFAAFKVNVTPAYAWEPVIFMGGRKRTRDEWTGRDWVSAMPPVFSGEARGSGLAGMKPQAFCYWLMTDIFGLQPDDDFVDLFHGSGAVARAWEAFRRQPQLFGCGNSCAAQELPLSADAVDPQVLNQQRLSTRDKSFSSNDLATRREDPR